MTCYWYGGIVCFACFGRSFLLCVFTASIFLKNGLRVPFVSLLCRNISFELSSKAKRNQETSSQKHMLSRSRVVKYRFIQVKFTTAEKQDWNIEQVTSGSWRFLN